MPNYLIHKLTHGAALSEDDHASLSHLVRHARKVKPRHQLLDEGEPIQRVFVLLDGWAYRSKLLASGGRLITDLILPGDMSHVLTNLLGYADHSVTTLTSAIVAEIRPVEIEEALERSRSLRRALRWTSLQTDSILRQTLINNGRRMAAPRIAHLICEVRARLQAVGVPVEHSFAWPLTQIELADVTGLTTVHVNRSLKVLREDDLILLKKRRMHVLDAKRLAAFCGFSPSYLHLGYGPSEVRRLETHASATDMRAMVGRGID